MISVGLMLLLVVFVCFGNLRLLVFLLLVFCFIWCLLVCVIVLDEVCLCVRFPLTVLLLI